MTPTLLIVDDEKTTREGLRAALEDRYDVYLADDAKAATELLEREPFDVLLTDFRLPNEDGLKLIARAKSLSKPPVCILMTAYGSEEIAVQAMKSGADDYIAKGRMQIEELEMRIARALRGQTLEQENVALRRQLDTKFGLENIIGESPAMKEIFDEANGGTLFLDEIGEIDASTQVKLLRFLGERTFERVGSSKTISSDVRVVTATNKNLAEMVRTGTFRDDLFFRLKVAEIKLPPLRERRSDIPLLANAFMREFARENDKPIKGVAPEAMEVLMKYPWPGNVRELRAALEGAVVFCRGDRIQVEDLPEEARAGNVAVGVGPLGVVLPAETVKDAEKQLIIRALKEAEGNRTVAAKRIGMSRRTLHRKLHEYQLENL